MRPCFFLSWEMDQLLSQYRVTELTMLGTTPSLIMNFLTQTTFFVPSNVEVYLALVYIIYFGILFETLLTYITII